MKTLIDLIKESKQYSEKFEYYTSLGFDEKVSFVLSVCTYSTIERNMRVDPNWFVNKYIDSVKNKSHFTLFIYDYLETLYNEAKNENIITIEDFLISLAPKQPDYDMLDFGSPIRKVSTRGACGQSVGGAYYGGFVPQSMGNSYPVAKNASFACLDSMSCEASVSNQTLCLEQIDYRFEGTDSYAHIEEKGSNNVLNTPTSTFRMTTNTASFGVFFNNIRRNRIVDKNSIRIEEMMNYFKYNLSKPTKRMFNINTEVCESPNKGKKLLFVGVQGKEIDIEKQNIVVLLDVSGSMCSQSEVTQSAIATVLSKLHIGDTFSMVTYSSEDETIFDGYKIESSEDILTIIDRLLRINIFGCTNGSAGIETAYAIGRKHYIDGGNNRVILITDGDLNFGITKHSKLEELIIEKKKSNLFLSVLGTGLYNYKDDTLEVLSKNGNGMYAVANNIHDIDVSLNKNYAKFMSTIAKDVKAQVEFNPALVKSYRLLGYENRELKHNDFKNDKVISEPYGSGGYGIALYEIEMVNGEKVESDLKYQKSEFTDTTHIATVKVRYKEPLGDESTELCVEIKDREDGFNGNIKLAYLIYVCAEIMRGSEFVEKSELTENLFELGDLFEINKYELEVLRRFIDEK